MKNNILNKYSHIILFLIGFAGIYLIAILLNIVNAYGIMFRSFDVDLAVNRFIYQYKTVDLFANYAVYLSTFLFMLPFVGQKAFRKIALEFKIPDNIKEGITFGIILVTATLIYNNFLSTILPIFTENKNEASVDSMILVNPVISFFVVGILGPIVEELTYRYGLFNFFRKRSKFIAYFITIIVFALIHFEFNNATINEWLIELLNLPSYLIAAFILCYSYDYKGNLSTSITAHVFNNSLSVLLTLLGSFIQ